MFNIIINILFIIFFPLLFTGIINRVKSLWAGREGPSVIQPFHDFVKLMKKGEVISTTASFIFKIAPSVSFTSVISAAAVTPLFSGKQLFSFDLDFIFFIYILALGKFFTITGAMDTGSSFEGMGASREAAFSAIAEPAFFLVIGSLALAGNSTSFSNIFSATDLTTSTGIIITVLSAVILFIMLLAEGSRVPVDDPNTHLELTMIHEVMVLDNSGPDFGLILYASALKMVLIGSLIANLILPEMPAAASAAAFLCVHFIIAAITGTIESLFARLRMSHVPQFIFFMSSIGLIILAVIVLSVSGGIK